MKLLIKSIFLLQLIIFFHLKLVAQKESFSQISPPSPEVAASSKHGQIPVSTYTGVPNVSVPIYTVSAGDINLPISLNYHASGIKVEEEASWVGLGWSKVPV